MYKREAELVNEQVLANPMNMNIRLGGKGGWEHITPAQRAHVNSQRNKKHNELLKIDICYRNSYCEKVSLAAKESFKNGKESPFKNRIVSDRGNTASQTAEAREKRIQTLLRIKHQQGEKNSQFGTCWIYSIKLQQCQKIKKDDLELFLEQGWIKGRKMKF